MGRSSRSLKIRCWFAAVFACCRVATKPIFAPPEKGATQYLASESCNRERRSRVVKQKIFVYIRRKPYAMKFLATLLFFCLVAFVSCNTQKNTYTNYLQNMSDTSGKRLLMREPVIQKADLLSIKVYSTSAMPGVTDAPYNLPEQTVASSSNSATAGFLVDEAGDIEYPRIGRLHVEGLTKAQVAATIRKRFENELANPSVIVRFLNYRITVLGEVRTPSTFTLPTERITILEALGLSGDITDYGNKKNVRVVREQGDSVDVGYVDLTSKNLFQSPYYRMRQNDVVFVEQIKRKSEQIEQQQVAQRIGIISGIISTLAIVYSLIRR